ncbi:MAG: peptidoglycan DD-metalloendopeptidase family protein [Nocardioidaceae bacterium]
MGSHRAADSGLGHSSSGTSGTHVAGRRRADVAPVESSTPVAYVGKRVARAATEPLPAVAAPAPVATVVEAHPAVELEPVLAPVLTLEDAPEPPAARVEVAGPLTLPHRDERSIAATLEIFRGIADEVTTATPAPAVTPSTLDDTAISTTAVLEAVDPATPGKRRASRHSGRRGPLFKGFPSGPVLAGIATMAVAVGGALTSGVNSDLISTVSGGSHVVQASALSGAAGQSATNLVGRSPALSRDGQRDAQSDAASSPLEQQTEVQAKQRDKALQKFAAQAQAQSDKIAADLWVLPVEGYHITNTFGMARSYYSSGYHTGLDFAAPYGTPIHAIADGVVTSASYDGAYGNKTVITLDDGTELWYCHQSQFAVSTGDTVSQGELIGYIGETGNAYGAHLHVEVHPGGGDAVDPFPAFVQHGVTP